MSTNDPNEMPETPQQTGPSAAEQFLAQAGIDPNAIDPMAVSNAMRLQQGLSDPIQGNELLAQMAQQRGLMPGQQGGYQDDYGYGQQDPYGDPYGQQQGYGEQPPIDPQAIQQMIAQQVQQATGQAMMQAQQQLQFDQAVNGATAGLPDMARNAIRAAAEQYQQQNPYSTYDASVAQAVEQFKAQVAPAFAQEQAAPPEVPAPPTGELPHGAPPPEQPQVNTLEDAIRISQEGLNP